MSHPNYGHGESHSDRLARKARDAPFMVVGLAGLVGLVGYGIYGFRSRKVKMSVYLIHMRVMAQGCVVLCLTAGVGYNIYKQQIEPKLNPPSIEEKKE